jgi:hypothetical protein
VTWGYVSALNHRRILGDERRRANQQPEQNRALRHSMSDHVASL